MAKRKKAGNPSSHPAPAIGKRQRIETEGHEQATLEDIQRLPAEICVRITSYVSLPALALVHQLKQLQTCLPQSQC
jgi:hypothetical protein